MVLLEAMAAGKPVIALDAPGAREVVKDGKNGRLLEEDAKKETFSRAIEEFFTNPKTAVKWSQISLNTAQKHSREAMVKRMLRLYRSVLEKKSLPDTELEKLVALERLIRGLKAEWDLVTQKASASIKSFTESDTLNRKVE